MGLPSYTSSHEIARRIPELLTASGFTVSQERVPTTGTPTKPSYFYRVSDGRHSATVYGEYEQDTALTIVIPRFSLRFGRRKFVLSLDCCLKARGFEKYPPTDTINNMPNKSL